RESGDPAIFRGITEAFETLGQPKSRAAYDVKHRDARRLTWKIFDQAASAQGIEAEKRKRFGVLSVLYRKRVGQPDQASMTLKELEDLLGVPKEHLEFTIWYLKEGLFVQRNDKGRVTITMRGVDLAEELNERADKSHAERKALPAARVA